MSDADLLALASMTSAANLSQEFELDHGSGWQGLRLTTHPPPAVTHCTNKNSRTKHHCDARH